MIQKLGLFLNRFQLRLTLTIVSMLIYILMVMDTFILFWIFSFIVIFFITKENKIKIFKNTSQVLVSSSQEFLNLSSHNHPFKRVVSMNFMC